MPSSFTPSLRLTLPVTGENSGTWGDLVNNGITSLVDSSVAGYAAITMTDANYTLTSVNGAADEARRMMLNISGTLTAARNVICPTASKLVDRQPDTYPIVIGDDPFPSTDYIPEY